MLLTQKKLALLSTGYCQALYKTLYPLVCIITAPTNQIWKLRSLSGKFKYIIYGCSYVLELKLE